jgi:SAM-dependent methyltransferase
MRAALCEDRPISTQFMTVARYYLRAAVHSNGVLRRLLAKKGTETANAQPAYWDKALSSTHAAYMKGTVSIDARNGLVAVLIRHYGSANPAVLDVGCAGGSLSRALGLYERYVGVDISPYAVDQARKDPVFASEVAEGKVDFTASDLRTLPLKDGSWDVIAFNEVLYYVAVEEAVEQMARYSRSLRPGGIFCVSMKDDAKAHAIYKELGKRYTWKEGLLWQSKDAGPDYRVRITRERPAFLVAALAPRVAGG